MTNSTSFIEQRKQAILYQLDKCKCEGECPLEKPCRLTLAIHNKDICSILRDNQKMEEDNTNESTRDI